MKFKSMRVATILPLSVVLMTSCINDNLSEEQTQKDAESFVREVDGRTMAVYSTNHIVDIEEAKEWAMEADAIFNEGSLRSSKKRQIAETVVLTTKSESGLRAGCFDTTAYVFNFADNEGFAIVAADDRITSPILGYFEKGSFNKDCQDKIGRMITNGVKGYIAKEVATFEMKKDSLKSVADAYLEAQENLGNSELRSTKTTTTYVNVRPLLKTKWAQKYPYNYAIIKGKGKNYLVGCGAVAAAQVMAYYGVPKYVKGTNVEWAWDQMTTVPTLTETLGQELSMVGKTHVQALLYWVAEGIYTDFGYKASSSYPGDIFVFMRNNRYVSAKFGETFKPNDVFNALENKIPVIVSAHPKGISGWDDGHTWVLDGCIVIKTKKVKKFLWSKKTTIDYSSGYFHHNWGWEGCGDGWLEAGVFNPSKTFIDSSEGVFIPCDNDTNYCTYKCTIIP